MADWTKRILAAVAMAFIVCGSAAHAADEIKAGPIWNNMDAQGKCPGVCSGAGGTWDGNWHTTVPGQQSVCSCDMKHKPDKNRQNFNAGPIWNNADAQTKCPAVCISHDRTWTGNWHTKVEGKMSECQCKK